MIIERFQVLGLCGGLARALGTTGTQKVIVEWFCDLLKELQSVSVHRAWLDERRNLFVCSSSPRKIAASCKIEFYFTFTRSRLY